MYSLPRMASAILCIAVFWPSLVAHGSAFRVQPVQNPTAPQEDGPAAFPQQPGPQALHVDPRRIENRVDAAAIVFGAYDPIFFVDACNVAVLLIKNGMQRDFIRLFLPTRRTCPDFTDPDSTTGEPDFTTGSRIPVEALITGRQEDLSLFCERVAGIDPLQRCSTKLLPNAENLFFFFSGHGNDNPPGFSMSSSFTQQLSSETNIGGLYSSRDIEDMLPLQLRTMVETSWPHEHGRLLVMVDSCHSALSFLAMLPIYKSNSSAIGNATKKVLGGLEENDQVYVQAYGSNVEHVPGSIPIVVITSTGVQTCTSIPARQGETKGSHFTQLMIRVWNRAQPKETVADWKDAIKRRSLLNLVEDDIGIDKVYQDLVAGRKPERSRTSPKFFGYDTHLESFMWSAFHLARAD